MSGFHLRAAGLDDVDEVLAFWRSSAEDTHRRDDRPAVERLLARDPEALVLEDNALAHPAWSALGYAPQPEWRRWVKPVVS